MDPWATHQELLTAAAVRSNGPIIELGAGDYSTPLLHWITAHAGHDLVTVERDQVWLAKFRHLQSERHALVESPTLEVAMRAIHGRESWGMAFVDDGPAERRAPEIIALARIADLVVVHDTEDPGYGYDAVWPHFKHVYTSKRLTPWTTIASNRIDPGGWFQ